MFKILYSGDFIFQLLNNRGRLRYIYSWIITNILRVKLQLIKKGYYKLPASGNHDLPPISLTSYAPRLGSLLLTLISLMEQNTLPSKIYVWLTKEDFLNIDKKIVARFTKSIVSFQITEDLRSHKKWLPMLNITSKPFVICDDDVFYPPDWYLSLIESDDSFSYVANFCHLMTIEDQRVASYNVWKKKVYKSFEPSNYLFPVGCGGTIVYPDRIPNQFRDWNLINKMCPNADDIWLKAAHLYNNIPCRKTDYNFPCIEILGSQSVALYLRNVDNNENDIQLHNTFAYFNLLK